MPGRSKLKQGLTQTSKEEGGKTDRSTKSITNYYSGGKRPISYKKNDRGKIVKIPQLLVGGQAKLDKNKNNKIDAEDFKILKAEKAKGRGQGLQDEKMKPGKPMKAALGAIALGLGAKKIMDKKGSKMPMGMGAAAFLAKKKKEMLGKKRGGMSKSSQGTTAKSAMGKTFSGYQKVFKTGVSAGEKAKATSTIVGVKPTLPEAAKSSKIARRALKAAKATRLGKMLLPVAAAGVAAQQFLKSKMKKKKEEPKKKMGGGMMKRPMGYKAGMGSLPKIETGSSPQGRGKKYRDKFKSKDGLNVKDTGITIFTKNKKMGGGMMQRSGYSVGGSVTVKTKLGRNKPTKMY
jgi:hypothetical protein